MSHYQRSLCRKVYVGGLGNNGTKYELQNAFSCYGPLKKVWIARNPPGFAFVEFQNSRDAQDAVSALNGSILCGRHVRVELSNRNSRSSRLLPNQSRCSSCGKEGHSVGSCFLEQQLALMGLTEYDSDDFDDDFDEILEMIPEIYYLNSEVYDHYDFNSGIEHLDIHPRSCNHRNHNNGHQDQHQNDGPQNQHRNHRPQNQSRNVRPRNQPWNDRPRNQPWNDRPRNQRWNDRPRNQPRNDRPRNQHSNDRPRNQHRTDRSQDQQRNNSSQIQNRSVDTQCPNKSISSTPFCSPVSNKPNDASNDVKCVICLDTVDDQMEYILCGHSFHAKCCNDWLSINDTCPICRTEVASGSSSDVPDINEEGTIDNMLRHIYYYMQSLWQ